LGKNQVVIGPELAHKLREMLFTGLNNAMRMAQDLGLKEFHELATLEVQAKKRLCMAKDALKDFEASSAVAIHAEVLSTPQTYEPPSDTNKLLSGVSSTTQLQQV
jgi:hypothetical protein